MNQSVDEINQIQGNMWKYMEISGLLVFRSSGLQKTVVQSCGLAVVQSCSRAVDLSCSRARYSGFLSSGLMVFDLGEVICL
jgi:hypothetical protein